MRTMCKSRWNLEREGRKTVLSGLQIRVSLIFMFPGLGTGLPDSVVAKHWKKEKELRSRRSWTEEKSNWSELNYQIAKQKRTVLLIQSLVISRYEKFLSPRRWIVRINRGRAEASLKADVHWAGINSGEGWNCSAVMHTNAKLFVRRGDARNARRVRTYYQRSCASRTKPCKRFGRFSWRRFVEPWFKGLIVYGYRTCRVCANNHWSATPTRHTRIQLGLERESAA